MTYELGDIFKDASLTDIHEYLLENKVTLDGSDEQYLYHAPCHDPIKIRPHIVFTDGRQQRQPNHNTTYIVFTDGRQRQQHNMWSYYDWVVVLVRQ
jgi:hypothetical protein